MSDNSERREHSAKGPTDSILTPNENAILEGELAVRKWAKAHGKNPDDIIGDEIGQHPLATNSGFDNIVDCPTTGHDNSAFGQSTLSPKTEDKDNVVFPTPKRKRKFLFWNF